MKPLTIVQHEPDDPPGSIAVALTELGVPFEVCRVDLAEELPAWPDETAGLISLGGAMHATQTKEYPFLAAEIKLMRRMVHEGGPVWGICLGAQLLAIAAGGDAYRRKHAEVGWTTHREGRRRPAAPRHLLAVRRVQLARVLVQDLADVAPGRHLRRRRAGLPRRRPGLGHAVPPRGRRGDGARTGCATRSRSRSTSARGSRSSCATRRTSGCPAYPAFCRRITENFVVNAGLLPG